MARGRTEGGKGGSNGRTAGALRLPWLSLPGTRLEPSDRPTGAGGTHRRPHAGGYHPPPARSGGQFAAVPDWARLGDQRNSVQTPPERWSGWVDYKNR